MLWKLGRETYGPLPTVQQAHLPTRQCLCFYDGFQVRSSVLPLLFLVGPDHDTNVACTDRALPVCVQKLPPLGGMPPSKEAITLAIAQYEAKMQACYPLAVLLRGQCGNCIVTGSRKCHVNSGLRHGMALCS